ncbi:MAG TPA: zinc ribbon domain-containing protein [Solirubrobacteraceae bacterium]|nr:zinc ribbon domain-containing protein [Solirubrobacteraceae bacterium]
MSTDAIRATDEAAPTTELVTAAVGDRCAKCQTPLAADQRYCLNCGERRGRARFSPAAFTTTTATTTAVGAPPVPPRQPRLSSAASLVAGVATLLIALGVGVLIGHDSNGTPARSQAAQIITVGGGTAAPNTATTSSTPAAGSKAKSGKKAKPTVVHVTAKTAKAATAAASKVLGSGGSLSHNVTQKVGGACSGGAGCQGGKFTGNFFPGG